MKIKLINFVLLTLLLLGCNNEPDVAEINYANPHESFNRTKEDAVVLACYIKNKLSPNKSRASIKVEKVDAILGRQSRNGSSDTLIYVVNFSDNQGYALISAPKNVEPILAITESGSLTDDSLDCGVAQYVSAAKEFVNDRINLDSLAGPIISPDHKRYVEWITDTLINKIIPTKVDVKWGQSSIYGKYCPPSPEWPNEGITGCGPTALAMIMSYFEYPNSIVKTFDGSNELISLDWPEIKKHTILCTNCYIDYIAGQICYASKDAHDKIGLLMREIGEQAGSVYNGCYITIEDGVQVSHYGTSTTSLGVIKALSYFGFNAASYGDYSLAISHFNESNVMIVFGGNHIFIVDGLYRFKSQITERIWDTFMWELLSEEIISTTYTDMVHVNWGYDGRHNGMYNSGVFDMYYCKELDDPDNKMDNLNSYPVGGCILVSR